MRTYALRRPSSMIRSRKTPRSVIVPHHSASPRLLVSLTKITRYQEGHDLAASVGQKLIAAGQPGKDNVAAVRMRPVGNDIVFRSVPVLPATDQIVEAPPLHVGERGELLHLHGPGIQRLTSGLSGFCAPNLTQSNNYGPRAVPTLQARRSAVRTISLIYVGADLRHLRKTQ
jgi:hypothetical protein